VSVEKLRDARPYVIVGAFIIAAVVTPPDVLSRCCWPYRCACFTRRGCSSRAHQRAARRANTIFKTRGET